MATHVKVLGGIFLAIGVLGLGSAIVSAVAFGLVAGVVGASGDDAPLDSAVLGFTGLALTIALTLFSLPSLICGWGLLKFRPWARILAIVLAAISLIVFPFGTVFGVYALWVLFSKKTEPVFETG